MKKTTLSAVLLSGSLLASSHGFPGPAAAETGSGSSTVQQAATATAVYPDMDHVGFVVKDAGKAVQDTLTRFGLAQAKGNCITGHVTGQYGGKNTSYSAKFCMVEIGDKRLEFIEPIGSDPSPYLDTLRAKGDTVHHLAFMVPSIDARLDLDRKKNPALNVVQDARLSEVGRYVYVDGIVPGTLVEYGQPAPQAPHQ